MVVVPEWQELNIGLRQKNFSRIIFIVKLDYGNCLAHRGG